eukprot:CAMPEP_0183702598 /NCGR_PEP_ID=MMETSP0737-20130205/648_1 /TAXON_ID=385413 /ORGANISM="Thalassiosira miniscula, Strain CCMP1093" /LENGTH=872 /DNA_ID=CAMNT_0025929231 /DNA_START=62 /DNA_END=2680 /DNA_ORIENTATION=-
MRNHSSIGVLFRLKTSRRSYHQCHGYAYRRRRCNGNGAIWNHTPPAPWPLETGTPIPITKYLSSQSFRRSFATETGDASDTRAKSKGRRRTLSKKLEDDGLTLSHFITKSAAADVSQSSIHITQTANNTDTKSSEKSGANHFNNDSSCSSPIPMAAELGDEFDEAFMEQDLMVTDAMSSSNKNETMLSSPPSSNKALDRLGKQMIHGDDGIDHEEANRFHTLKFHIKTYGCQMNVNDTDIVRSILLNNHTRNNDNATTLQTSDAMSSIKFVETDDEIRADVLLTNTCAIRENAENKVWHRLRELRSHDRNFPLSSITEEDGLMKMTKEKRKQLQRHRNNNNNNSSNSINSIQNSSNKKKRIIGVLGCMAERLKEDMFRDGTADLVVGPDAYRDLPRLISVLSAPSSVMPQNNKGDSNGDSNNKYNTTPTIPTERAVNVQLSLDETYASITPVRANPHDVSAFVSIMRGCNNMCSYCVVPFTRGRERSRDVESVVEETRRLLDEEGIREVILLGQNVNSYHDNSGGGRARMSEEETNEKQSSYQTSNEGFSNMFRMRHGDGYRFADLLEAVSSLSPELRVRFTSPHPKDYPPPLLSLMAERPNICNHLHMPAQSGSSTVLQRMRRGYGREAYLELIDDVREAIPDVAISSDFITGFCGETEEEHYETLSLMEQVQYDQAFMFAYSMRGKTHAHRTMEDDVPADVKNRRLNEVIDCFRRNVQRRNDEMEVGKLRLVLVEGEAKKSTAENRTWSGRTDQNKRVVFASDACLIEEEINPFLSHLSSSNNFSFNNKGEKSLLFSGIGNSDATGYPQTKVELSRGDYAVVQVTEARGHTLKGQALWRSSIVGFEKHLSDVHAWNELPAGIVGEMLLNQ